MKKLLALITTATMLFGMAAFTYIEATDDPTIHASAATTNRVNYKSGDVDGDGKIDIIDAVLIMNHINGAKSLNDDMLKRADFDGVDEVNIVDAAKILKHIVGDQVTEKKTTTTTKKVTTSPPKTTDPPRPVTTPPVTTAPPKTTTPTPTTPSPDTYTTYVLNTNSHKFHYSSCSSVKKMKDENKWHFNGSRSEIISMGYDPCERCKP